MGQIFKRAADGVRNSAFVIPITLVFFAMLVISIGLFVEDYSTSYFGYLEVPTRKANDWVVPLVALIPQLAQIGFGYVFASDTNKRYAILITFICFVIDAYTDIVYKSAGSFSIGVIAFFETITIYTLFSEIMFLTSFGMLVQLLPDFWKQLGIIVPDIISSLIAIVVKLGMLAVNEDAGNKSRNNNRDYNKQSFPKYDGGFPKRGRGRPRKEDAGIVNNDYNPSGDDIPEEIRNWTI